MTSPLLQLVLMTFVTAAALVGYGSGYSTLSSESRAVADLQQRVSSTAATVGRVASVRAAVSEIADDEMVIQEYFVPESEVVAFINDLEARGLAQKAAVKVLSVATAEPKDHPALVLSLSIRGTFDSVMRTVGSIEYAPYAISITSFSIVQEAADSWHAALNLSVGSVASPAAPAAQMQKKT